MSEMEWKIFGKSPKGTAIHFVKDGKARCDKTIAVEADSKLTILNVTCAKCRQYKDFKDGFKRPTAKKTAPAKKTEFLPTAKETKKPKKKPPAKKPPAKKPEKKTVRPYDISIDEPDADFAARKERNGFNIIHIPTETTLFNGIPKKVIEEALLNLNVITERWPDKHSTVPKDFITKCRKAVKKAFESCKVAVPEVFTKEVEKDKGRRKKPKTKAKKKFKKGDEMTIKKKKMVYDGKEWIPVRTIKRRKAEKEVVKTRVLKRRKKAEPEKRVIRRRKKKEKGIFGMNPNKPPATIAENIHDGVFHGHLVEILQEDFKLTEKRAKSKIKGVIRRLSRKKGVPIRIDMGKTINDDYYSLT